MNLNISDDKNAVIFSTCVTHLPTQYCVPPQDSQDIPFIKTFRITLVTESLQSVKNALVDFLFHFGLLVTDFKIETALDFGRDYKILGSTMGKETPK